MGVIGAYILRALVSALIVLGPTVAGYFVAEATKNKIVGWVVGLSLLALFVFLFGPSLNAIEEVACRGSENYQACIDGD